MAWFSRNKTKTRQQDPVVPEVKHLPENTRELADRLSRYCADTPAAVAHCDDVIDQIADLDQTYALLTDREQAFLTSHADQTRHTLTGEGQSLLHGNSRQEPIRQRIGLERVCNAYWSPRDEAEMVRPLRTMRPVVALLKQRTLREAERKRRFPRRDAIRAALLGYDTEEDLILAEPDLYTSYYNWLQPEAMPFVLDRAAELIDARRLLDNAAVELNAQLARRLEQLAAYVLLDKADQRAVDTELQLALSRHTGEEQRQRLAHNTLISNALGAGIEVATAT